MTDGRNDGKAGTPVRERRATARHAATVTAVTFLALLVAAGLRSAPALLLVPVQFHFGWSLANLSFTAALGILFYGLVGPFAATLMLSFGIRRTMAAGLALMAAGTFASLWMTQSWQYLLSWGVVSGIGSGAVAPVLGAAVVNRWFARRQGLIMGLLSASTATGALVFLPFLAWLSSTGAWQPVVLAVTLACLVLIPIVALTVPERPADIGTTRFGETADSAPAVPVRQAGSAGLAISVLFKAARRPIFWLLFGTFFVCGLTTNGLIGTHLIAYCGDHGIAPVAAAGLLSLMGLFDLVGTTASGWLTDRYNPRLLLVFYYGIRGLSLLALPFLDFNATSLALFAIFYGLDWIATVPPTVKLTNEAFGEGEATIVFGWVQTGHQLGAAVAAFGAGLIRQETGTYLPAFLISGAFGLLAAGTLAATIRRSRRREASTMAA